MIHKIHTKENHIKIELPCSFVVGIYSFKYWWVSVVAMCTYELSTK